MTAYDIEKRFLDDEQFKRMNKDYTMNYLKKHYKNNPIGYLESPIGKKIQVPDI